MEGIQMQKEMIDGCTSFTLPTSIAKMMENEGVTNEWKVVTKYYSVRNPMNEGTKYIYIAYDSESMMAFNRGHIEMEHFESVWKPDLIVVFGHTSRDYYRKLGYKTHLLNLGYDDLNYKEVNYKKRKWDISFVGTMDHVRWSDFYLRTFIGKSLDKMDICKGIFTNDVKYEDLGEVYANSVLSMNDVIRLSPNMRMFEIPSYGSFMLINNTIREFINKYKYPLKEGAHYGVFNDFHELCEHIKLLNEHKEQTIEQGLKAKELILKQPLSGEVSAMCRKFNL